eukprot:jgi/Chlat1/3960/Chrsp26S04037
MPAAPAAVAVGRLWLLPVQPRLLLHPGVVGMQALCSAASAAVQEVRGGASAGLVLAAWRAGQVNENRLWGAKGPCRPDPGGGKNPLKDVDEARLPPTLAECGHLVLTTPDPLSKAAITHAAFRAYSHGSLPLGTAAAPDRPARPPKPMLVPPKEVPTPKQSPLPLNAHTLHNLAHIELNAIDLAWDTVVRFSDKHGRSLPEQFYADFARVADDESRHLSWCLQRLGELGFSYGDIPAHNVLWEGAESTRKVVAARLAVIPMGQEARGLDAGERLADRLVGVGDARTARLVRQIAVEETAHVAVGVFWFTRLCDAAGVEASAGFQALIKEYQPELLKGPFNHDARAGAGLQRHWYDVSEHASLAQVAEGTPADMNQVRTRLEHLLSLELSSI